MTWDLNKVSVPYIIIIIIIIKAVTKQAYQDIKLATFLLRI